MASFNVLNRNVSGETEENNENSSRISDFRAEM
jgi:hypothetical protein